MKLRTGMRRVSIGIPYSKCISTVLNKFRKLYKTLMGMVALGNLPHVKDLQIMDSHAIQYERMKDWVNISIGWSISHMGKICIDQIF